MEKTTLTAKERIRELESKIESRREEIWDYEREIRNIYKENSFYWILKTVEGNGDYWDEYYHTIGFCSMEDASRICREKYGVEISELPDNPCNSEDCFYHVSEEEFDIYKKWQRLDKAVKELGNLMYYPDKEVPLLVSATYHELEQYISNLVKKIGIEYQSYQHIANSMDAEISKEDFMLISEIYKKG